MNKHHLENMARLIEAKAATLEKPIVTEEVLSILTAYWKDMIALVWTTGDVIDWAYNERELRLTEEEAREVLHHIFDNMDAEEGVNWNQIENAVEQLEVGIDVELAEKIDKLTREQCVKLLESISIQCRDEETVETLREAVRSNVADKTISVEEVIWANET